MADETIKNAANTAEVNNTNTASETITAEHIVAGQNTDYKAEYEKLKASFDKASSDVARFKKELSDRSTKEENERRDREERDRALMEELEQLRTDKRIGAYSTNIMGWGVTADTAKDLASKLPDGVSDDFFAAVKGFIENEASRIRAEALNAQPKPTTGAPVTGQDIKDSETAKLRKYIGL